MRSRFQNTRLKRNLSGRIFSAFEVHRHRCPSILDCRPSICHPARLNHSSCIFIASFTLTRLFSQPVAQLLAFAARRLFAGTVSEVAFTLFRNIAGASNAIVLVVIAHINEEALAQRSACFLTKRARTSAIHQLSCCCLAFFPDSQHTLNMLQIFLRPKFAILICNLGSFTLNRSVSSFFPFRRLLKFSCRSPVDKSLSACCLLSVFPPRKFFSNLPYSSR